MSDIPDKVIGQLLDAIPDLGLDGTRGDFFDGFAADRQRLDVLLENGGQE